MKFRLTASAIGAAVCLIGATGCASSGTTAKSTASESGSSAPISGPAPSSTSPNIATPDAVGKKFAIIATTWYPATDATETAAVLRATALLTPAAAATVIQPQKNASAGIFNTAAAAGATHSQSTAVMLTQTGDDLPADTKTSKHLKIQTQWSWETATNVAVNVKDGRLRSFVLSLDRQSDGTWLISSYDYYDQQSAATPTS